MGTIRRSYNTEEDLNTLFREFDGGITSANILDGTIVNADINASAAIAISKTTLGTFTDWADWTPSYTGFSADPTTTYARYSQVGKIVVVSWQGLANGTKNGSAGTYTFTLPLAPKYAQTFVFLVNYYSAAYQWSAGTVPASSTTMTVGQISLAGSSLTATLANNYGANLTLGWGTASNFIVYEVT